MNTYKEYWIEQIPNLDWPEAEKYCDELGFIGMHSETPNEISIDYYDNKSAYETKVVGFKSYLRPITITSDQTS